MQKQLSSDAPTTRSPTTKQVLLPFSPWPRSSPKFFVNPPFLLGNENGISFSIASAKANHFPLTFATNSNLDQDYSLVIILLLLYQWHQSSSPPARFAKALLVVSTSKPTDNSNCSQQLCPRTRTHCYSNFPALLFTCIFPTSWKLAQIFPHLETGESLTPSIIIQSQSLPSCLKHWRPPSRKTTYMFLETTKLLSDHQFGFQQERSTGDLLVYGTHVWSTALESLVESIVKKLHRLHQLSKIVLVAFSLTGP